MRFRCSSPRTRSWHLLCLRERAQARQPPNLRQPPAACKEEIEPPAPRRRAPAAGACSPASGGSPTARRLARSDRNAGTSADENATILYGKLWRQQRCDALV